MKPKPCASYFFSAPQHLFPINASIADRIAMQNEYDEAMDIYRKNTYGMANGYVNGGVVVAVVKADDARSRPKPYYDVNNEDNRQHLVRRAAGMSRDEYNVFLKGYHEAVHNPDPDPDDDVEEDDEEIPSLESMLVVGGCYTPNERELAFDEI